MMRKQEIRENVKLLNAMVLTYEDCTFISDEQLRTLLMARIIRKSRFLFQNCEDWLKQYRNGYKSFEMWTYWSKLAENELFEEYGEENIETVQNGLEIINKYIMR